MASMSWATQAEDKVLLDLKSEDAATRRAAVRTLKANPPKTQVVAAALLPLVTDPDLDTRWAAIDTLGEIGPVDAQVLPALIEAYNRNDPGTHNAWMALKKIGLPAAKALAERLPDPKLRSGFGVAKILDDMAPLPKEFVPLITAGLRANNFDDEGLLSSALSKTDPDANEAVPLIAATHNAFWYDGKQRRIHEALQRMSSPEARSIARVLRVKRTAALLLFNLPIVWLYVRLLIWAYRRLLAAKPIAQYLLVPGLNYAAFVMIGLSSWGLREVFVSFGFPGTPLVQLPAILLYTPIILIYAFPIFAATALLSWGLIGGVPLARKSRPVGRGEAMFSKFSLAAFALLVVYMLWSKNYMLPLPPPI